MSTDTLIADRIEIADLFTRFARLLDEERWEGADTVFAGDVAVRSPAGRRLREVRITPTWTREN
ncbi:MULTISPECIES: nuclear transport factor 2 family protein [unclassified Streptosporangium]|uniref:nuclear transport factor 2 family protein n=1 Tax=unclassified Streptosporangium TaxID=2632669 RepID=UPI002E2A05E5|nr:MULTISPECIES: nuclear transport factor 2 family protein [unclassified Streptosporangium]